MSMPKTADGRKFQRAAEDERTHKHRINKGEACGIHIDAVSKSKKGKTRKNGQGMWKCSL